MAHNSDHDENSPAEFSDAVDPSLLSEEVYRTLRDLARRQLRREGRVLTLETSALVHEAWIRLAAQAKGNPTPRPIFLAIASRVMRQVLVDYARSRNRLKRRAEGAASIEILSDDQSVEILAIHTALERLERADARKCHVVEMRFFGGCSVEETAEALGVSPNTVINDWNFARRWLARRLGSENACNPNATGG